MRLTALISLLAGCLAIATPCAAAADATPAPLTPGVSAAPAEVGGVLRRPAGDSDEVAVARGELDGLGRVPHRLDDPAPDPRGRSVPGSQLGALSVLVVRAEFTGERTGPFVEPFTKQQVQARLMTDAGSANELYKRQSGGTVSLRGLDDPTGGDVTPWVTVLGSIPTSLGECDADAMRSEILAALAIQQPTVAIGNYQHVMLLYPETAKCPWAGLGELPGSVTWINGLYVQDGYPLSWDASLMAHELGHNLGAAHAAALTCFSTSAKTQAVALSAYCNTLDEYGDPFDFMGGGPNPPVAFYGSQLMSSFHRTQLRQGPDFTPVTANGTYTLTDANAAGTGGTRLLRVPRGGASSITSDNNELTLELRRDVAPFDDWSQFPLFASKPTSGVIVRVGPTTSVAARTQLVDTHPLSSSMLDAPLNVGDAFTDAVSGLSVSVASIAADGSSASVNVSALPGTDKTAPDFSGAGLAVVRDRGEAVLSWNPATDAVGVSGYDIVRDGATIGHTEPGITTYRTTLPLGTGAASFRVDAVDRSGNRSSSASVSVALSPYASGAAPAPQLVSSVATDPTVVLVPRVVKPALKAGKAKLPKTRKVTLLFPGAGAVFAKVKHKRIGKVKAARVTFKLPRSVRRNGTVQLVASGGTLPSPVKAQLRIKSGVVRFVITG